MILMCLCVIMILLPLSNISIAENESVSTPSPENSIESWYIINYKGEKIGYMHTLWENLPYQQTDAWKITTETIEYTKTLRRTIYLEKNNLSFLDGTINQQSSSDLSIRVQMLFAGNKLILTYPAPTNQIEFPLTDEKIYCEDSIGKWIIQQSPAITNTYTFKIIYEDRVFSISDDPIVNLNFKVLEKAKERIMDKETEGYRIECQYTDNTDTAILNKFEILIDEKGNLLKLSKGELIVIKTSQEEAKLKRRDKFMWNNRPDPFIPKYKSKKGGSATINVKDPLGNNKIQGIYSKLEAVAMVKNAHNSLLKMIQIKNDVNYKEEIKDKDLTGLYLEILATREKIAKTEFIDLQGQMEQIIKDAEKVFPVKQQISTRAELLRDESARLFGQIKIAGKSASQKGLFEKLTQKVQEIGTLVSRTEIQRTEYETKIAKLSTEVKDFNRRAEIIREFYTNRNIKIEGIISHTKPEDVSLPALQINFFGLPLNEVLGFRRYDTSSTVLINGQFYHENTRIDENLFLKNITSDKRAVFIYKGEEIILN